MPEQTRIRRALAQVDPDLLPGLPTGTERTCEGAKFHSPTPILLHAVSLADGRSAHLCGVCRDNLTVLLALGEVDWETKREFGNKLRRLTEKRTDG
jgi:hypothetical protein